MTAKSGVFVEDVDDGRGGALDDDDDDWRSGVMVDVDDGGGGSRVVAEIVRSA